MTTVHNTVPSAGPSSTDVTEVTSSSITVQWEPVDCIYQNGAITGYSIHYGVENGTIENSVDISGESVTEATISDLMANTIYEINIFAVNSEGKGSNSLRILAKTLIEGIL